MVAIYELGLYMHACMCRFEYLRYCKILCSIFVISAYSV